MGRRKRIIPFIIDIKNVSNGSYFILLAFFALYIYQRIVIGGSRAYFIQIQTPMFFIAAVGVLVWVLPAYVDYINPDAQELLLSFPMGGIFLGFLRTIRLILVYIASILILFYVVYLNSDLKGFKGGVEDALIIAAALFFLSGLGLFSLFIVRYLAVGFAVPIFWLSFSYFYNGAGTWILHPCQWLKPKYALPVWQAVSGLFIAGLIFILIANWLLRRREYLLKG